ncbi:MAG: sugar ABC transporter substrate-binding protein [Devosia sp.]|jgi:ABC-type sugar transport system substrate-binding protein|uniref:sugar ABC transporter substrate-binding protein n=1 Tax=Devosia sp. TaxID=1871048 RepID=UPI0037BE8824
MLRRSLRVIAMMALTLVLAVAGFAGTAAAQDKFKLGMAVGGNTCCEWMKAQGDVARALAEKMGWDYVELSNNNDPATALKNAQIFVQEGVDAVIQFNGQPSSNPAIAAVLKAANIPIVTYDIADPGMYFVGIDNLAAGIAGGEQLGMIIKDKWNCEPDLVISSEGAGAGIVNEWRTGGMRTGVKNICPNIPAEKFVSFEGSGDAAVALQPARDLLAANPNAVKMAVVGINDGGVLGLINAAEQLGRADQVIGWGQDGAFITGDNVNPHLVGSVFYFLEGYAVYAIRDVIGPIAEGKDVPLKADAGDPASKVQPCPVSAEQAKAVPDMNERVVQLLAAPAGTTAYDLFCPNKG